MRLVFVLIFTSMYYFGLSQNSCDNSLAIKILNSDKEGFNVEVTDNSKIKRVVFNNPTKDTLYIFASYFEERFYKSKYLNRINKKTNEIKLSFLPLLNNLSTSKSDRILPGSNAIITRGQLKYKFILLPPNTFFDKEFNIDYSDPINFSKDFDLSQLNMSDKLNFKNRKKCSNTDSFKRTIEFAIYRNIKNLCNSNYFFKNPKEYNSIAREYEVYKLEILPR